MAEKLRYHRLDPMDLEKSMGDPALAALVADGWRPIQLVLGEETIGEAKEKRPFFGIILLPPEKAVVEDRWLLRASRAIVALLLAVVILLVIIAGMLGGVLWT